MLKVEKFKKLKRFEVYYCLKKFFSGRSRYRDEIFLQYNNYNEQWFSKLVDELGRINTWSLFYLLHN